MSLCVASSMSNVGFGPLGPVFGQPILCISGAPGLPAATTQLVIHFVGLTVASWYARTSGLDNGSARIEFSAA